MHGAALAFGLPARRGAGDAGERVQHGVEVGREPQTQVLVVVAGVDDHREVPAAQPVQAIGELRGADLPGECDHGSHASILIERFGEREATRAQRAAFGRVEARRIEAVAVMK